MLINNGSLSGVIVHHRTVLLDFCMDKPGLSALMLRIEIIIHGPINGPAKCFFILTEETMAGAGF